jgi:hypothetical protein
MKDYPQIEMPSADQLGEIVNRLMNEEMNYDKDNERDVHYRIYANFNDGQKIVFHVIMESVVTNQGKLIFVDGPGGIGKTYLWKAVTTKIWSEGKIVLAVASCEITALLLVGGRTTHSQFHIPLNTTDESTCDIKQDTDLAALLNKTLLIILRRAHVSLIPYHTHGLHAQVPKRGKINHMRFMKNLNKQIVLTTYLNHS